MGAALRRSFGVSSTAASASAAAWQHFQTSDSHIKQVFIAWAQYLSHLSHAILHLSHLSHAIAFIACDIEFVTFIA
jgi:hypothetical protein